MPNKMERFTQRARRVLMLAEEEAVSLGQHSIGPEHLLLGMLREEGSVAYRVLNSLKITVEQVRSEIGEQASAESPDPRKLDIAEDTKHILEASVREARRMGHHYIGTEHLLLGMLRKPNAALKILTESGIDPDSMREEVRRLITQEPISPDESPAEPESNLMDLVRLREEHLKLMQRTCLIIGYLLDSISQEEATTWRDQNDAPNGWTVLDILCHLADFDLIFYERARLILERDNPTLIPYDHEQLLIDNRYSEQNLNEVYARLKESRERFVDFFQNLDDSMWSRAGIHPKRGRFTLMDALIQVGTHEANHLEQIARIIHERKP